MSRVVGVRFQRAGRVQYFDPGDVEIKVNDQVVVETDKGLEIALVVIAPSQVVYSEIKEPLKPITRKATQGDVHRGGELKARASEALVLAKEQASALNLPMKFTDAGYTLDGGRLVIQFTADGRVDFRALLYQLVQRYRVKVELRQIGPRDEAKALGGLGRCGQVLCCARWLTEFCPITVKMAKEQALPISAENLAGNCGRLRCCLRYEYEEYVKMNRELPRIGEWVMSPYGRARVVVGHPLKSAVSILLESQATVEIPVSQVTRLSRN
ncbi:MAG: hypothetical protein HW388_81 [Dehalococcoidia bacterium]|nr:hypothetical protein [Dehalococcoidia bacterium]